MNLNKDHMNFSGYVSDIKKALETIKGSPADNNDSEIIATTLYSILNSYYFNNLYNFKKIGVNENNEYSIRVIPNKNIENLKIDVEGKEVKLSDYSKVILGEQRRRIPANDEIPFNSFPQDIDLGISLKSSGNYLEVIVGEDVAIEPVKAELRKINPIYDVIFEENSLKQDLIKKSKRDIEFVTMNEQDFKTYVTENVKSLSGFSTDEAVQALNSNYDLRYLVPLNEKRNNSFYIVAKSGDEIAGVIVANENNNIKQSFNGHQNSDYAKNFLRITSIMVSANHRGKGLGNELFDNLLKECEKNNYVLIVSNFTDLGKMHLKKHIANVSNKSAIPVIDDAWLDTISKNVSKLFGNDFNSGLSKLKAITDETRDFYNSMDVKRMEARSADDIYDIEDLENAYLAKLEGKFSVNNSKLIKNKM